MPVLAPTSISISRSAAKAIMSRRISASGALSTIARRIMISSVVGASSVASSTATQRYPKIANGRRKPLARYGAMGSERRERLAPTELHKQTGHGPGDPATPARHGDALTPPIAPKDIADQQSKSFVRGRPLVTGDADFGGDGRLIVAYFVAAIVEGDRVFRLFSMAMADVPVKAKPRRQAERVTDSGWKRILDIFAQVVSRTIWLAPSETSQTARTRSTARAAVFCEALP